jgi:hypothetical protein
LDKLLQISSNAPTISLDNFAIVGKTSVTIPSQITTTSITSQASTLSSINMWNSEFSDSNKLWSNGKSLKTLDDNYDDSLANGIRERELLNLIDDN